MSEENRNSGTNESDGSQEVSRALEVRRKLTKIVKTVWKIVQVVDFIRKLCDDCGFDVGKIAESFGSVTDWLYPLSIFVCASPAGSVWQMVVNAALHAAIWWWFMRK